jgi:hypothetical protein
MLLSKWVVGSREQYSTIQKLDPQPGFCMPFRYSREESDEVYPFVQRLAGQHTFALWLSEAGLDSMQAEPGKALDSILTIFFQPAYYTVRNSPVIFVQDANNERSRHLLEQLKDKTIGQGFSGLYILSPVSSETAASQGNLLPGYYAIGKNYDLNHIIDRWITGYMSLMVPLPVHLIISGDDFDDALHNYRNLLTGESAISTTRNYQIASTLYEMNGRLEDLRQKLMLQQVHEKNIQLYLDIQKKDLAKALDWYQHEYEINPLWYKQFGHIIKVMMGKRSFRSLFNDNVKKYKD